MVAFNIYNSYKSIRKLKKKLQDEFNNHYLLYTNNYKRESRSSYYRIREND